LLSDDERFRVNVFDWRAEFPNVFRAKDRSNEMRDAASPMDYTQPGVPLHGAYAIKKFKDAAVAPPAFIEPDWEGALTPSSGTRRMCASRDFQGRKSLIDNPLSIRDRQL